MGVDQLAELEFAAQDRAEQKVVKLASETGEAAQGGDLRPMSNLVDQDVSDKFSGRGFQRIVHQTFHECLQIGATLPAKLKERFDTIVRNRGRIG